eukprot:TRINITY_DN603_c0_g1_i2.p1 TRINITY_DN603_c0_g1~~TRINITY_DN603_c0_g1_i2.p1  ORF type:complete len:297 (-),score=4.69 TRINITY_DN603_c0_g1_i2:216-1106(-)
MGVSYPYTNYPKLFDDWDESWIREGSKVKWSLSQLKSPSEKLHRMETLAFWRLLKRAAMVLEHRRPVELRSEEAIRWDIKEHQRGKKSCDNQRCSDQCDLRSFLKWPKGIPLHDPQSFKDLGMEHKKLRETFVDAVYNLENQGCDGPSHSLPSMFGLGKLGEPVHSTSASGSLHVEVPPRTTSWLRSVRSTGADPDTLSAYSCQWEDFSRVVRRVGEHDPDVQPNIGALTVHDPQIYFQGVGDWDPTYRRAIIQPATWSLTGFKVSGARNKESDTIAGQSQEDSSEFSRHYSGRLG